MYEGFAECVDVRSTQRVGYRRQCITRNKAKEQSQRNAAHAPFNSHYRALLFVRFFGGKWCVTLTSDSLRISSTVPGTTHSSKCEASFRLKPFRSAAQFPCVLSIEYIVCQRTKHLNLPYVQFLFFFFDPICCLRPTCPAPNNTSNTINNTHTTNTTNNTNTNNAFTNTILLPPLLLMLLN